MIILALVLIALGLFLPGWGIALWIGLGVLVVGLFLNFAPRGEGARRGRYW